MICEIKSINIFQISLIYLIFLKLIFLLNLVIFISLVNFYLKFSEHDRDYRSIINDNLSKKKLFNKQLFYFLNSYYFKYRTIKKKSKINN